MPWLIIKDWEMQICFVIVQIVLHTPVSLYFKFPGVFYLLVKSKVPAGKAAFHVRGLDISWSYNVANNFCL